MNIRYASALTLAAIFLTAEARAQVFQNQIPSNYYDTIDTSTEALFRSTLNTRLRTNAVQTTFSNTNNSYNAIEFGSLDHYDILMNTPTGEGHVRLIYSFDVRPILGNTRMNDGNPVTGGYNREHMWPQSLFGSVNPITSDLHALLPCDADINTRRSNNPFGNVITPTLIDPFGNRSTTSLFEPQNRSKGDAARTIFYMDVRYEGTGGTGGSGDPRDLFLVEDPDLVVSGSNAMGILSELIQWHFQDPPDTIEYIRNQRTFTIQQNANPFIDRPEWVSVLYGVAAPTPTDGEALSLAFNAIAPPTTLTDSRFVPMLRATTTFTGVEFDLASLTFEIGGSFPLTTDSRVIVFIDENQNDLFDRGDIILGTSTIDSATMTVPFLRPLRFNQLVPPPRLLVVVDLDGDPAIDGTQLEFAIAENGAASTDAFGAGADPNPLFPRLAATVDFPTSISDWGLLAD